MWGGMATQPQPFFFFYYYPYRLAHSACHSLTLTPTLTLTPALTLLTGLEQWGGEGAVRQQLMETLAAATARSAEKHSDENGEKDTWAQCDLCDKWRRLPLSGSAALPEEWSCDLNPNRAFASCQIAEEICQIAEEPVPDPWDEIRGTSSGVDTRNVLRGFCRQVLRNSPELDAHPTGIVKMREWLRDHWPYPPSSPAPTPTSEASHAHAHAGRGRTIKRIRSP